MFGNMLMGAAGASLAGGGGYSVDNSIVLDDGSSQYLTRTPSAAGNLKTFTVSFWFKRGNLGIVTYLLKRRTAALGFIRINADDTLTYYNEAGGVAIQLITTQVFRDPHSWYHLVVVQDTTQATASDRAKMYLNGSEITAFNTAQYNIAQNGDGTLFDADTLDIGQASTQFWDGYLSEYCYIDGTALTETSFGEYDTNGVWRPIDIASAGLTFGNNGFYLPFTDSGQLGADSSTGNQTSITLSGEWTGDTSDFTTLNTDIVPALGQTGAIKSVDTFTGDFAIEFEWQGGANPAYLGVYEIDEDGSFSQTSADGGMGSMTDSFYLFFTSGNAVNAVNGSSTEASSIFTAAAGEVVKFQRSGSTFTVYEDGVLRHTFTATSANEVRIVVGQNSSSMDWRDFRWVSGGTITGNPFTPSGSPTQSSDTPTNNSATLTTIDGSGATFSNGNLVVGSNTTNSYKGGTGCIGLAPGSGSWYVEALCTGATGSNKEYVFGAATNDTDKSVAGYFPGSATYSNDDEHGYYSGSGGIVYNGSSSTGSVGVYGDGNTVALRFDMDETTPTCKFYVNDTLKHTANLTVGKTYYPHFNTQDLNLTFTVNFGATSFTYTLPTGHLAINTTNLYTNAAPAIEDGTAHFQATAYTGNGSDGHEINQSGNSTFKPSFTWFKNRDVADSHALYDLVRGITKRFYSNSSAVETTTSHVASFDADGFTVNADTQVNGSGDGMIAWQWKGDGTSGASNTNGTITSTVNVDDTAGFSIVSYTGNGTDGATVGHGQTGILDMIIVKNRDAIAEPLVFHAGLTNGINGTYGIELSQTNAQTPTFGAGYIDGVTSSVFALQDGTSGRNNVNDNTEKYIAYCFRSIPGYSAFGSYEGNASADGPLILLDFKPAFIIVKNIDTTGAWLMFDNAREPANVVDLPLEADDAKAEAASGGRLLDFLSNGFKPRGNSSYINSSHTFIYMAFAENPFAGSSPATAR